MYSLFQRVRAILILFLLTACGTFPSTPLPSPTVITIALSPSSTPIPTLPPTLTATPIPQAYFCVNLNTPTPVPGCTLPTGQERDRFCVNKAPYTLIAISVDETYQVLTPNFTCTDNGTRGANHLLVCSGPQSYAFQIKVCGQGCAASAPPQSGPAGYCVPGFNYNLDNQCCMVPATDPNGCIILKFGTRSCGG